MCFMWIWEQTAIISLYNINWLVFITETVCVYCAVRTGSLFSKRCINSGCIHAAVCYVRDIHMYIKPLSLTHPVGIVWRNNEFSAHEIKAHIGSYKTKLVYHQRMVMLQFRDRLQQFRQFVRKVTLRRVCVTVVSVQKQIIFWALFFRLNYPACTAHAPYYFVICDLSVCTKFFPHYHTNCTILGRKLLNTKCVFWLHGEVDSVKKHNCKIWLNDGFY